MATPMLETMSRCGSRVEFSATTEKTTSPWFKYVRPSLRGMTLQRGGKMEETRTRFCEAMPASLRASSNEVSRSLCLPTPLVKKSFFGTMLFPNSYVSSVSLKSAARAERSRMSLSHFEGQEQGARRIHRTLTHPGRFPVRERIENGIRYSVFQARGLTQRRPGNRAKSR